MRRLSARIVVATAVLAIVVTVAWVSGTLACRRSARTFTLTGVASLGRWTLEPVNGLNYGVKDFEPATLFVRTGDDVVIHLRSADAFHRFYLPQFSVGPIDVEPGKTVTARFKAAQKGVFQFYCTSICGPCHFHMRGWLVVTDPGVTPIERPPMPWAVCTPEHAPIPADAGLVQSGTLLYRRKGCFTCHGPDGGGGVPNDNSTAGSIPSHDTTAGKLFLLTREDAEAFLSVLDSSPSLEQDETVTAFPIVRTRFLNAKEIIRKGRFTTKADPRGPQPPLQMPAWQYLLTEREIDALIAYFVTLQNWDDQ